MMRPATRCTNGERMACLDTATGTVDCVCAWVCGMDRTI